VLAVVEHDQHRAVGEVGAELDGGAGTGAFDAERVGHRREHVVGRAGRHEVHERRALGPALGVAVGDGHGDARLADAARPDQRDEPGPAEPVRDHLDEVIPADQLGAQARQPDGDRPDRAGEGRHRGEGAPVGRCELAEQRRDVGLDGPHRDVQLGGDLGVAQPLADERQHLRFPGRQHVGPVRHGGSLPNQWFPRRRTRARHGCIVTSSGARWTTPRRGHTRRSRCPRP
jgi:hypothetical protein